MSKVLLKVECLEDRTVPAVIINETVPLNVTVFVPCANGGAGELVHISGPVHVVIEETADGAGGFHMKEHVQFQGISGVGLITGREPFLTLDGLRIIHDLNVAK